MISIKNLSTVRGLYFLYTKVAEFFLAKKKFAKCSKKVVLTPPMHFGNKNNIYLGEQTCIGANAFISAINAKFICMGYCSIAENFTVHTGNHPRTIGKYSTSFSEETKPKGYDNDVIVEKDVWIGCNVTLLSGVTIGRGSTVAAGAVVSKSMPPYCICGGVPAKVIKFYWTIDQILEHEAKLYPENERYSREQLEEIFQKYKK